MSEQLPKEVGRGTMKIGDVELEVVHLDNGQRVITAESMERFFGWMNGEAAAVPMKNVTPGGGQP
jgi:hypothetical protein